MPTLNIRGRVMCFPGTSPLQNATVEIFDVDSGGNGDDIIFTGTTDNNGYLQGTSSDWKDRNTARVPRPWPFTGTVEVEVPDVLVLMARIRIGSYDTGRIPFSLPPPGAAIVPIVVPWSCIGIRKPKVNGEECNDGYDLQVKARAAFERGDPTVHITLYGPDAMPFLPFADKNMDALKALVGARLPGAPNMLYPNPVVADDLIYIAIIILCVGAAYSISVIATAVAIALILALILGYEHVKVHSATEADGTVSVDFEISK
ncbi:MAG: transthyretin-like family protein [Bacteroidetes bacterium]|nr:transthyretin-like family protein [Bacteroidota bacterium]